MTAVRVRDVMSSPVVAVTRDAIPAEAAQVMMDHGFTALPVLGSRGELAGLVTEADLARAGIRRSAQHGGTPEDGVVLTRAPRTVSALMTTPPPSVAPDTELPTAADEMLRAGARSVVVVERGALVGILTWRDMMRTLLNR